MPKTPYMRTEDIEAATLGLLADYGRKYKPVLAPPVPVEEILEGHLELTFIRNGDASKHSTFERRG